MKIMKGIYKAQPILNWSLNPKYKNAHKILIHNEYGFRKSYVSNSETLYCIGGSGTYCFGVEETENTWPYLLGKSTGLNTINGGIPGYIFFQSLMRFLMWRKFFNVKYVVAYDGKNDLVPLLTNKNMLPDFSPNMKRFRFSPFTKILNNITLDDKKKDWRNIKDISPVTYNTFLSYYANLKYICSSEGIKLIIIPQITKTIHYQDYLSRLYKDVKKMEDKDCKVLKFEHDDYFFDNTHFSVDGCKKFSEWVFKNMEIK